MHLLPLKIAKRIDDKLKRLNKLRPLPKSAVQKLWERFQIEMTYNSNAIEGNSLTLKETFLVINEGITIKGKPLKDHLEAKDHATALNYLYDMIQKDKKHTISERTIRMFHQLVVAGTDDEWAGRYRNADVFISGADHKPPHAEDLPHEMHSLVKWLRENMGKLNIIELAALLHHKLVFIHPFFDGNGRTARLVMNVVLMQKGYPLTIILKNDRKKYYDILSKADSGNDVPLVRFIARNVERSLDIYLKTLSPKGQNREEYHPLSKIAHKTPYSSKYLNLLAQSGKLEAHKEGRIWVTSKEAIARYIESRERKRF